MHDSDGEKNSREKEETLIRARAGGGKSKTVSLFHSSGPGLRTRSLKRA